MDNYKLLWEEICYLIKRYSNATEREFQLEVEHIFEKLGWSRFRGEIQSQTIIPVGAIQSLKPDIILLNNDKRQFVVELKKPNSIISNRNSEQLISYMLQLQLDYGFLIGENIQLYYNLKPPKKILEIPFTDNDYGVNLVKLLLKQNFSISALKDFCDEIVEKNEEKKLKNNVENIFKEMENSVDFTSYALKIRRIYETEMYNKAKDRSLKGLELIKAAVPPEHVTQTYDYWQRLNWFIHDDSKIIDASNEYKKKVLKDALEFAVGLFGIKIDLKPTHPTPPEPSTSVKQVYLQNTIYNEPIRSDTLQIELVPSDQRVFKIKLLEKKLAYIYIYYSDGKIEEKPWRAWAFRESSNVFGNLRSRPEFRQGWQKRGITKVVVSIERLEN